MPNNPTSGPASPAPSSSSLSSAPSLGPSPRKRPVVTELDTILVESEPPTTANENPVSETMKAKPAKVTKKRPLKEVSNPTDAYSEAQPKRARPTRSRKAPARFAEEQIKPTPKKPAPARGASSKVFDPVYVTTNANSRLGKADIYHMLLEASAWDVLDSEERGTLLKLLPPNASNIKALESISEGALPSRPKELVAGEIFRTDVAKFQEDLTNGHLAKTWQAAAEQAMKDRAAGVFDEWKAEEIELWWGENQQ